MPSFRLHPYTVYIKPLGGGEPQELQDFGEGHSLYDTVERFLYHMQEVGFQHNERGKKVLRYVGHEYEDEDATLYLSLRNGQYGLEQSLFNTATQQDEGTLPKEVAAEKQFYFMLHCPVGHNRGLLLSQKWSTFSAHSDFVASFKRYFADLHPNFRVHFERLVPMEIVMQYLNQGMLETVDLITYHMPEDKVALLDVDGAEEALNRVVFSMRSARGEAFPRFNWLSNLIRTRNLGALATITGQEVHEVRMEFQLNGERKSVYLSNPERFVTSFDISDRLLVEEETGMPTPSSMMLACREIAAQLLPELGLAPPQP